MKQPIEVTSEGPEGPAYVRYSRDERVMTRATPANPDVVVDYDRVGNVIGVELVCLEREDLRILAALAHVHSLALPPLRALRGVRVEEAVPA